MPGLLKYPSGNNELSPPTDAGFQNCSGRQPQQEENTMSDNGVMRVRALNDNLRCRYSGGRIMFTTGILALGEKTGVHILRAIAVFNAFTEDNDPHKEHDCASMTVNGFRIIWKIDYYDKSFTYGSPDPSDPKVTERVMTVMLAEEY